jgi:hypothetical protein
MLLSEATVNAVRQVAESGLMDTALRLVFTAGDGDYNHGGDTYTAAESFACLVNGRVRTDAMRQSEVTIIEADLYFALTTTLHPADRVQITHLHGAAVASPLTYIVEGGPVVRGYALQHAQLVLLTE